MFKNTLKYKTLIFVSIGYTSLFPNHFLVFTLRAIQKPHANDQTNVDLGSSKPGLPAYEQNLHQLLNKVKILQKSE